MSTFQLNIIIIICQIIKCISQSVDEVLTPCGISSSNLVTWYISDDFVANSSDSSIKWFDHSGKGNHVSNFQVTRTVTKHPTYKFIQGGVNDFINFPYVLQPNGYTLFYLASITGRSNPIIRSKTWNTWYSGFIVEVMVLHIIMVG